MDLEQFLSTKTPIAISDLTSLAAERSTFGDDVLAAFRTQAELRTTAAQAVLNAAESANRDSLLASEQREYERHTRERDDVLRLAAAVERRTEARAHVPDTQLSRSTVTETGELPAVLGKEQRAADWLQQRGGYLYAGEAGAEQMKLGRIVRALATGNRSGLSPVELRALAEGSDASGGYTVPEVVAARFIDRTRNAMAVMRAGAAIVPMTSDTLNIARLGQPDSVSPNIATAAWKTENALIDETDLTLERVQFKAKTLPVLLNMSVELAEDSVNVDEMIERELSQQLALELDRAALRGSGSDPEPRGVLNQSGVNTNVLGQAVSDFDFMVDAVTRLWALNHEPTGILWNASLAGAVAKFKETSTKQPLRMPDVIASIPKFRTNQIPNAITSPDSTWMYVGDWSQLLIGMRTSFRLEVSRVAGDAFKRLQIAVRAYLRADVQLAHPTAFDITSQIEGI